MPENRPDTHLTNTNIGRRGFLGGATLVSAAALLGTDVVPGHAAERTHSIAGTTLEQVGLPASNDGYQRIVAHKGFPLRVREDMISAKGGRDDRRTALASFVQVTDLHVTDVQSPMRVEFMHPLAGPAFRPQEPLGPLGTASLVRRINSLPGGPFTGRKFDMVVSTGDNTDNHETIELEWYLTILSGGILTANSGSKERWESVQTFGDKLYYNPESSINDMYKKAGYPKVDRYFERIMKPFSSPGLQIPWYAVFGNHDDSVQGTLPSDWGLLEAMYTGDQKLMGFADERDKQAFLTATKGGQKVDLTNRAVSLTQHVTPDAKRRPFTPAQFIKAHLDNAPAGSPAPGHGFTQNDLDAVRGYYTFQIAPGVTGISMDSTNRAGYTNGSLDDVQWKWLKQVLRAGSSTYYDDFGVRRHHQVSDQMFILFSHHTSWTMNNLIPPMDGTGKRHGGNQLVNLLGHYPNVLAWVNGHTHNNNIVAHRNFSDARRCWWEINTASHVDFPQMGRILEVTDNHDGTISLFATLIESDAPYQVDYDTTTPEGLASLYREFAANDRHLGVIDHHGNRRMGKSTDQNTELLLAHPWA